MIVYGYLGTKGMLLNVDYIVIISVLSKKVKGCPLPFIRCCISTIAN